MNVSQSSHNPLHTPTFGTDKGKNKALQVPEAPARSKSPAPSLEARPVNQRSVSTADMPKVDDARDIFTSGMFSDPKAKKAYPMGPTIFTEAHQRLIFLLREEGARLYAYNNELRTRLGNADRRLKQSQTVISELKVHSNNMSERNVELTGKLRDAQATLVEMDQAFMQGRNKRMSRIYGDPDEMEYLSAQIKEAELGRPVT